MLMPKRTKYRRVQRGRMKGAASRGNKVSYGKRQPETRLPLLASFQDAPQSFFRSWTLDAPEKSP